MLDVMHCRCLRQPAILLAVNAKETITMQHSLPHRLPSSCLAELLLCHAASLLCARDTEKEKGGKLGLAAGKAVDALHLYSVAFR